MFRINLAKFMDKDTLQKLLAIVVGEDDQPCLTDLRNVTLLEVSKQVDLKFQLLVDHVRKEDLSVDYVP